MTATGDCDDARSDTDASESAERKAHRGYIFLVARVKPKLVTGRSVASRRIASRHIRALTERRKKKEEKRRMSVVGIDFGNANNVVALARRKGIDVVLNDESKRETPSMLNFGEKQVRRRQTERERERRRMKEG